MSSKATQNKKESSNGALKPAQKQASIRKPAVKQPHPMEIIQRVRMNPGSLTHDDVIQLQSTIGNKAVMKLLAEVHGNKAGQAKEKPKQSVGNKDAAAKPHESSKSGGGHLKDGHDGAAQQKKAETPKNDAGIRQDNHSHAVKQDKPKPSQSAAPKHDKKEVGPGAAPKHDKKEVGSGAVPKHEKQEGGSAASTKHKKEDANPHKENKAAEAEKRAETGQEKPQQKEKPANNAITFKTEAVPNEKAVPQPKPVAIKGGDTSQILGQLANVPPAQALDAYSQAVKVSGGALEKQKQKTQGAIPKIPAPTGLPAKKAAGKAGKAVKPIKHEAPAVFKSKKSGGEAYGRMPGEIKLGSAEHMEENHGEVMSQIREYSAQKPTLGMSGEADPSQVNGFKDEAAQNVKAAKQAELGQANQDFGENNIFPQPDNTVIKADKAIHPVAPPTDKIKQLEPIPPYIAVELNRHFAPEFAKRIGAKQQEYAKGKEKFDADVITEKANTNSKIEQMKVEAKQTQLKEQAAVKAEVNGLRSEWKNELNSAEAEYANEAGSASEAKKKEIEKVKTEKENAAHKELASAEKEAKHEVSSAKSKAAEEKKKEKEKDKGGGNIFQKAWNWAKDKAKQFIEGIKKAISAIYDTLKKGIKFIFDKAKKAVQALIEAGRKLIVGLIKELGNFLKKVVSKVFAKFPAIAKRICDKIDKVTSKAINAVNKAADLLKKGVNSAIGFLGARLNDLFKGVQSLYKGIVSAVSKINLNTIIEGGLIAAEVAAAFATGGASVILQIGIWLGRTLPELLQKAGAVMGFVNNLRNFKLGDITQLFSPSKTGEFLVKGLFGELGQLPMEKEEGGKGKEEKQAGGREGGGLIKIFNTLAGVFKTLKGVYNRVAGGINKVLSIINITSKPWFKPFSVAYAGVAKAIEIAKDPGGAINNGAAGLKGAAENFYGSIKSKVMDTANSIKEKMALVGNPAGLMKILADKALEMVLNFVITHPPSALIKAIFKAIEAGSGKSIVELIRQKIPFADKIINKIAGSGPVQTLLKPLEQPVKYVSGVIDDVSVKAVGMVDTAEQKTVALLGSGAKMIKDMAGVSGGNKQPGKAGKGGGGGGDFLGTVKSGIHTRLLAAGQQNAKDIIKTTAGKAAKATAEKVKGLLIGPKLQFKIGKESHELWVERQGSKNVVMMASVKKPVREKIPEIKEDSKRVLANIQNMPKGSEKDAKLQTIKEVQAKTGEIVGILDQAENDADKKTDSQIEPLKEKTKTKMKEVEEALERVSAGGGIAKKGNDTKDKRMSTVIEVPAFEVKPKYSKNPELKEEYARQVKGQEEGLNKLTIKVYLENREAYLDRFEEQKKQGKKKPSGRDPKGSTKQQEIREEALEKKFKEYLKQGLNPKKAKEEANKWMETQAALHDPDQIAGGDPNNVTGMGNKRINYSIGSQWKTRANVIENGVTKYSKDNNLSEKDKEHIYLNVKLSCKY